MSIKRWVIAVSILTVTAAGTITGCSNTNHDGALWQTAVSAAYEKNAQIANHAFEGKLKLDKRVDDPSETKSAASPLNAALAKLLSSENGLDWKGVAYSDPLRLEADIALQDEKRSYNVPLLLQDNKLYVSIPTLNKENEYFLIDKPLDLSSTAPFDPAIVLQWQEALDTLVPSVVAAADPRWVTETSDSGNDESGPKHVEIEVTEKNADSVAEALQAGLTATAEKLEALHLSGSGAFSKDNEGLKLSPGGTISASIDADGFLTEQKLDVAFENGDRLQLTLIKTEINGQPEMTKDVPANVLSFSDVLKFIIAGRTSATQP